jgi:hypothetical protein
MIQFWDTFQNWWKTMEGNNVTINKTNALFGVLNTNKRWNRLNTCLQLARWYIYTEKLNLHQPFLYRFLINLKYKIKIKKIISLRNDQLVKYNFLWEEIEEYLD